MQRLLDKLSRDITDFLDQRDEVLLVVRGTTIDAAYVLPVLQALQAERPCDPFWTFSEDFSSPSDYASRIIEAFSGRRIAVNEVLAEKGLEPWPELPSRLREADLRPIERLRMLLEFARDVLPDQEARCIWTFFPNQIERQEDWSRFVRELMAFERLSPWCHRLRCIVRDEPGTRSFWSGTKGTRPPYGIDVDFSHPVLEQALEEDVNDTSAPQAHRLQALLITAAMDMAQQRYDVAIEKYNLLAHYHLSRGAHLPAAMSLNGLGEVYCRRGQDDRAERLFGAALEPALNAGSVPVLLNISLNLGELSFRRERWEEAEMYFDGVARMALLQDMPEAAANALERIGSCREQLRRREAAAEAWEQGALLARKTERREVLRLLLEHLERHYRRVGERERLRAIVRELEECHEPH